MSKTGNIAKRPSYEEECRGVMVRKIIKDPLFLQQKSEPATEADTLIQASSATRKSRLTLRLAIGMPIGFVLVQEMQAITGINPLLPDE